MKTAVFNPRKQPRLLRTHIPLGENLASLAVLVTLALLLIWVAGQKDNYDPASRDVSVEQLLQASTGAELYNRPLQRWSEAAPGSTAGGTAGVDLGPYPPAVTDASWRPTGAARRFVADNLFEKINGEAPKFLKQGFQSMHYLVLANGQEEIAIELYDQGDVGGSMGIFADHLAGDRTVEKRDGVTFFRTSIGLIGRKGQYFFRAAGDSDSDAVRAKSLQLAGALAALPEPAGGDGPAELQTLRDVLQVPAEQITFQKRNVFQYDFAGDFWFAKLAPDSPARAFLHRADDEQQAAALYAAVLEEHGYEYQLLEQDDSGALFWHEFLQNHFTLRRSGATLFGVENVAERGQAEALTDALAEALNDA